MQKIELIKPKETPFLNQCWVITFLGRLRRGSARNVNLRPLRLDSKLPAKTLLCCFVPQPPWLLSLPPLWEWNGKAEHWNMRERRSSMMDQKAQTRWVWQYIYLYIYVCIRCILCFAFMFIVHAHCLPLLAMIKYLPAPYHQSWRESERAQHFFFKSDPSWLTRIH